MGDEASKQSEQDTQALKKNKSAARKIKPGMNVETTRGDLGEADVNKPKVTGVVRDEQGNARELIVKKGIIFKKKVEIPVDRVESIDTDSEHGAPQGKVTVDVEQKEAQALKASGKEEELPTEAERGLLDEAERVVPTHEGLRELETINAALEEQAVREERQDQEQADQAQPASKGKQLLRILGPGFLSGMAGNDSSAVTAYAVDGATSGYSHLWLMLLSTPLYQAIQYACAKIGRMSGQGFSTILRDHYGRWLAVLATVALIITNVALIAADLVAIGSGLELITKVSWVWFVVPVAVILWYITVYRNFESIKKIFIILSLVFVTYIVTAIFSKANWGAVLLNTFVPHLSFGFATISSAVALLGATFSPYSMFWQVQGEKEQKRPGSTKMQLRSAGMDIASGVISGNLVAYFIIVCTSATIFIHHGQINTAADAAKALQPLLGPVASYLFAVGLIGSGLIAIPILLASTSYAVAGTFGWPGALSKKPWQNEGFYLILTVALVVSLALALLRFDPIQLIFWANVVAGILAPVMVALILLVGNNRKIMRD
ncbi:MAG TPA: divalent metal cation transporter, partial [Ktedonobacteraceae bacterium]|nr:divalent metal cation transporter [Ktedonobacteraceae bacterium]